MSISSFNHQNGKGFYQSMSSVSTVCSILLSSIFFFSSSVILSFDFSFNLWPVVHPNQHHHYFVGFARLLLRGLFPRKIFVPFKVF